MKDEDSIYEDPDVPAVRTGEWSIQNIQSLEWALGRLAALEAERDHIDAAVAEAKKRLDERREELVTRALRGIGFFESHIAKYATENREAILGGGNRKSRVLLHGTVGWRRREGRLVVVDAPALQRWLREQDDVSLFRVKIEPEMAALQENFKKNGVIPPGMEYVETQEKLYIEAVDPTAALARKDK